jgi:hypothetical protein
LVLVHDEEAGALTVEVSDLGEGSADSLVGAVLDVDQTRFSAALRSRQHILVDSLAEAAPWPVPMPGLTSWPCCARRCRTSPATRLPPARR